MKKIFLAFAATLVIGVPVAFSNNYKTVNCITSPAVWDDVRIHSGSGIWVKQDGLWGLIDQSGIIINPQWEDIKNDSPYTSLVKKDGLWGLVDNSGKLLLEPRYTDIGPLSEGHRRVCEVMESDGSGKPLTLTIKYLDEDFNETETPVFTNVPVSNPDISYFNHKDGVIFFHSNRIVSNNSPSYLYDKSGKLLFKSISLYPPSEGLIGAGAFYKGINPGDNYSISEGQVQINNLTVVSNSDKPLYGFVNLNGDVVIPFIFDEVRPFNQGLAPVKKDGLWGFIDQKSCFAVEPFYDEFYAADKTTAYQAFFDGLAYVKKNGKWGAIDKQGKVVIDISWDNIPFMLEDLAAVSSDGLWGYVGSSGMASEPVFDDANSFKEGIALVKKNDHYFFIDYYGQVVSQNFDWEYVLTNDGSKSYSDIFAYKKDGLWGIAFLGKQKGTLVSR